MFETNKDLEGLAADLQDAIRHTRRMGFMVTADARTEVLRELEQAETRRQPLSDDLERSLSTEWLGAMRYHNQSRRRSQPRLGLQGP